MSQNYQDSITLLTEVVDNKLYEKLINQLNKDFQLVSLDVVFHKESSPLVLKTKLQEVVKSLLLNDSDGYYNLLYRIDVSEISLKNINTSEIDSYSEEVTFLILKRVWKKVYFKNKFFNYK
ncbi:hypothetical protein [uncultured Tenacibaculum sp.]|uniref:hypothetical protein n=1 Tax=uncultured Tenacibaculum sp. TaxID=174713 RepID=UPI002619EA2E|nr:hypothetical protein [uncultured Tenacibaculum sp.]